MPKKKKIILISIIIFLVMIGSSVFIYYQRHKIIDDNTKFTIKNDPVASVYSKVNVSDYLESIEGKLAEDVEIDTKELGEKEVSFIYQTEDQKKRRGHFTIEIVDDEAPLVWLSSRYQLAVGSDVDLTERIMCADNYDTNPNCRIEGDYDLNTAGNYSLQFVATDNSGNQSDIAFTLQVYEPVKTNTTSASTSEPVTTDFSEVVAQHKTENTKVGIDVSKWQGDIDFKKVKAAGAQFVMIRVGSQQGIDGDYVIDPYFKQNIEAALAEDLEVGVYFYSYADTLSEAKKQAEWVLRQIDAYDISLPVAFDWECYSSFNQMELSLFGLNQIAEIFLDTITDQGYEGMLYGSKNYLNAIWTYHEYPVWLAHYTDQTDYEADYVMWQLCQNGTIDGIDALVDINILYQS